MTDGSDAPVPAGFEPVAMGGSFITFNGPFYVRRREDALTLGLRLERRHCNAIGHCHGGLLATFADMLLTMTTNNHPRIIAARRFTPTVSLQLDYLAPAHRGDWLEGDGQLLKVTRSIVFVQGLLSVDAEPVLRASGVFKLGREIGPDSPGMLVGESPLTPPGQR